MQVIQIAGRELRGGSDPRGDGVSSTTSTEGEFHDEARAAGLTVVFHERHNVEDGRADDL